MDQPRRPRDSNTMPRVTPPREQPGEVVMATKEEEVPAGVAMEAAAIEAAQVPGARRTAKGRRGSLPQKEHFCIFVLLWHFDYFFLHFQTVVSILSLLL